MRLSLPRFRSSQIGVSLLAACLLAACTTSRVPVEQPCPPAEKPAPTPPPVAAAKTDALVPRTLDVRLAPVRDDAGAIVAIDVAMRFSVPPVDFGDADPIVLRLDSVRTNPEPIDDLVARDSEGSLALRRATAEAGKPAPAEWRSERRARGPVTISYRFELPSADAASDEVAVSAEGILGIGRALFLFPVTTETHMIRVRWDLQGLGEGARGSSSFGGDESEIEGSPATLGAAIWAAGRLDELFVHSGSQGNARFRLVSIGGGPFDVVEVGPWANRMWLAARTVAPGKPQSNFDLFVRSTGKTGSVFDVSTWGGSAIAVVDNGAQFGWPEKLALTRAFVRVAWSPFTTGTRWYDEGFVTYHALDTMRRTGLTKSADIALELAKRSERYFASPWLRTPFLKLAQEKDPTTAEHAEDRGLFFAAEVDATIRKNSGGKRSLQDLLHSLVPKDAPEEAASSGTLATALSNALEKELGIDGVKRIFQMVVDATGAANLPDDAFGPCFKKVKKKIQREQPGGKKRETVDGFTWSLAPKPPANCGGYVGGLQKTP